MHVNDPAGPGKEEAFDRFLGTLYDGVLQNDAHRIWLSGLQRLLGADMTNFLLVKPGAPSPYTVGEGFDEKVDSDWLHSYQYIDPIRTQVVQNALGTVSGIESIVDHIDKQSRYYKEYFSRLRIRRGIILTAPLDGFNLHVSILRTTDHAFGGEDIRLLTRIGPHIGTAWRTREEIIGRTASVQASLAVLDRAGVGFAIVNIHGGLLHANETMTAILSEGRVLSGANAQLATLAPGEQGALETLIRTVAGSPTPDEIGALSLTDPSGERATVIVAALSPTPLWGAPAQPSAAVIVLGPRQRRAWSEDLLRVAFGLTTAEARVAALLAGGRPTGEIAAHLGIRTGTARAHIKAVLSKTGTHSQAELLSRIYQAGYGLMI